MLNNLTALLPKLDHILTDPNSQLHLEEKKIWGRIRSDIRQLVPMQSSRPKRSLLPFGGRLLSSVFGTATEEQVNAINKKVVQIVSWAKKKGHLMRKLVQQGNVNSEKIALLNRRIGYYAQKANLTGRRISSVNLKLDRVLAAEFTEGLINDVLRVDQGVVLAHRGIVTPNLLLPATFSNIIDNAVTQYNYRPLFPVESLSHYYGVLHSCVLGDRIFIFIPFSSAETLSYYEIKPFPTFVNVSLSVELVVEHELVLLTKDLKYVSFPSPQSLSDNCFPILLHEWLCPATNVHFLSAGNYPCVIDVLVHRDVSSRCSLRAVDYPTPRVLHLNAYNYLYTSEQHTLTLDCSYQNPHYKKLLGNLVVSDHCGIDIPNVLRVFPSLVQTMSRKIYVGDTSPNIILPVFSNVSLQPNVLPITDVPFLLKEDYDATWWDLSDYKEVHTVVTLPVLLILSVVIIAIICYVFYVKKTGSVLKQVRIVRDVVSGRRASDDQSVAPDIPPVVESS